MVVLRLLAACLVAGAAGLLLLLSTTFGSGGFGGSLPNEHEALSQVLLLLAVVAPGALLWLTGAGGWAVVGLQVALVVAGVRLGG